MKRLMELGAHTKGDMKTRLKRGVAVGSAGLALSLGLGACSGESEPANATPDPKAVALQEHIARLTHQSETIAKAYECSIDPAPIYEIAPTREEGKRRLKYGWVGVKLNLKMTNDEAIALNKQLNPVHNGNKTIVDYKQDTPVAVPFPLEKPFDSLNAIDTIADIFPRMNQEVKQNEDGTATIEYNVSYLPPKEGEKIPDMSIGVVMDSWTIRGEKSVRARGAAICGRIHFGDKGWEIVKSDKPNEKGFDGTLAGPGYLPTLPGENPKFPELPKETKTPPAPTEPPK